ncbi:hypothetical protein CRUP_037959 [Coryphaenoides rupestris]|nr:hypothetical protein CRUP_037959 [Coryphaenoides rupestris]
MCGQTQSPSTVVGRGFDFEMWKAGYYTVVHFAGQDLTILWDRKTTVHIRAGPQWKCESEYVVKRPCEGDLGRQPYAKRECALLYSDVFAPCHNVVDVTWFYKNCLTDTCNCNRGGDCECLCTSIAAYAHKCCQQGVTIQWRSPSVCQLGDGPFSVVSAAHNDTVFGVNRSSSSVFPLVRERSGWLPAPSILFNFMVTAGLQKDRTSRVPVVSLESAERPNYFLVVSGRSRIQLERWARGAEFSRRGTFIQHQGLFLPGHASFELVSQPGFFLTLTRTTARVQRYENTEGFKTSSSFTLEGVTLPPTPTPFAYVTRSNRTTTAPPTSTPTTPSTRTSTSTTTTTTTAPAPGPTTAVTTRPRITSTTTTTTTTTARATARATSRVTTTSSPSPTTTGRRTTAPIDGATSTLTTPRGRPSTTTITGRVTTTTAASISLPTSPITMTGITSTTTHATTTSTAPVDTPLPPSTPAGMTPISTTTTTTTTTARTAASPGVTHAVTTAMPPSSTPRTTTTTTTTTTPSVGTTSSSPPSFATSAPTTAAPTGPTVVPTTTVPSLAPITTSSSSAPTPPPPSHTSRTAPTTASPTTASPTTTSAFVTMPGDTPRPAPTTASPTTTAAFVTMPGDTPRPATPTAEATVGTTTTPRPRPLHTLVTTETRPADTATTVSVAVATTVSVDVATTTTPHRVPVDATATSTTEHVTTETSTSPETYPPIGEVSTTSPPFPLPTTPCTPPYSYRLDECAELICFNGELLLHNSSLHCRYNTSQPHCSLLGLPILTNTDPCCPQWQCPCRCSVMSDLRVITFDGNNVALYDNGSYILVHLPRETIIGTVEKCPTSQSVNSIRRPSPTGTSGLCFKKLNITTSSYRILINRLDRKTPGGVNIQWYHSTGIMVLQYTAHGNETGHTRGLCACTDNEGRPRAPDEVWNSSQRGCCLYQCLANGSVVAVEPDCSSSPALLCEREGEYVLEVMEEGACCPKKICVCDVNLCPESPVSCAAGLSLVQTAVPGHCCPEHRCEKGEVCVFQSVTVLGPGQSLVQYFAGDLCYTVHCLHNKDPDTGYYAMEISSHQEYVASSDPQVCCGSCRNVSCSFSNDNGTAELFTNGGAVQSYVDGCCKTCKEDGKTCKRVAIRTTIRKDDCRSNAPVTVYSCDGKCPSATIFNFNINSHARFCKCCRESGLQTRTVTLYCSRNATLVDYNFQEPLDCSCQWN